MDLLTVWASEIEIFAAAQILQTSIFGYVRSGGKHKHAPIKNAVNCIQEAIYLTHISNHYETVKIMVTAI